jgi:iron complex transport system substrate-binding protein
LPVLALAPRTLDDIFHDILLIARQVDAITLAEKLVRELQIEIERTRSATSHMQPQMVYCEEWGKPLIHSQPWVAELIAAAGGSFVGTPGAHTTPDAIADADPHVLLFAWCGAGDRVPLQRVIEQRNWQNLRAVHAGRVFCIPDEFLNTPSFNLLDGLQSIAGTIHPEVFPAHPAVKIHRS